MRKLFFLFFFLLFLPVSTSALELSPPEVPSSGEYLMPNETDSFSDALWEMLQTVLSSIQPDLTEAAEVTASVFCIILAFSLLQTFSGNMQKALAITGSVVISSVLLSSTNSLIHLASSTITELSDYGKLLLPVMTAAMASQGGAATSTALYIGTAAFDQILTTLISGVLVPAVYFFLSMAAANSAVGENILKKLREFIKWFISWTLKTVLTIFTTYMGITGVVSGTTDAVALKATKFTISSVVPVVGGILSDASEAILVSAGLLKNAAGIYGILAVLAVFLAPFLKIGVHYVLLKLTAALCSLFGVKHLTELVEDFSTAMGFLLAMTGATCLFLLISTICFLKGVG